MTDLTDKFSNLQGELESNHLEIQSILNDILDALGQAPPADASNQDIVDAIAAVNTSVATTNSFIAAVNSNLIQVNSAIQSISSKVSTSNSTLSAMLNFFVNNDWCCNEAPPWPTFTPPLSSQPSQRDEDRCKRAQRAVDIAVFAMDILDQYLYQAGPTTNRNVFDAYNSSPDIGGGYGPSGTELSNMAYNINNARNAGITNLGGLLFSFKASLIDLLYSADNAVIARQSLVAWTQSAFSDPYTREILGYIIHNLLLNAVYDDVYRILNTTGYNGSVCSVVEGQCSSVSSYSVSVSPSFGHSPRQHAVFASLGPLLSVVESSPGLVVTYGEPVVMTTGFQGGRIYFKLGRVRVVYGVQGVSGFEFPLTQPGNWVEIPLDADFLLLDDSMYPSTTGSGAFEVTFCTAGDI